MANKVFYFKGICNWAKVQKPDDKYDVYTLDLFPDEESMGYFMESGLELKLRDGEIDGEKAQFIKLRRPTTRKWNNTIEQMGPPQVLINDGEGNYSEYGKLIGNGSEVVCKVRVYDTDRGKGHELVTVAIEQLVPYEEAVGGDDFPF